MPRSLFRSSFIGHFGLSRLLPASLLAFSCVLMQPAAADTLDKIQQTRTITIGGVKDSWPFSFAEGAGLSGYSIDLCTKVIEAIRKDLKLSELRVQMVPITNAERFPKLADNVIDMECGSTTITQDRLKRFDFSYTMFVAGMKILSKNDAPIEQPEQLNGQPVALIRGTTSEKLFQQLHESTIKLLKIQPYASGEDAFKALEAGKVQALPYDDVLLSGMTAPLKDKERYRLSSAYLSIEPYGIMVRKGDSRLLAIINRTLSGLYANGEIERIYAAWFNTDKLKIPMSRLLREAIRRPNTDPGFAQLLGYTL